MRETASRLRSPSDTGNGAALVGDFVLFPVALAAVLVAFFYLPIGVVAAMAQDGITEEMRWFAKMYVGRMEEGTARLGPSTPALLELFRSLQPLARFWPLAVGAAFVHVGLRRLVRRGVAFGESLAWDAVSPMVTTPVGVFAFIAWYLVRPTLHFARTFGGLIVYLMPLLVLSAALAAIALAIAGLVLALALRHRGVRLALAAALVAAFGIRMSAEAWGRAALQSYRERRAPELAAQDAARAARLRPVLRDPAIDEDAWPRYQRLIDGMTAHLKQHSENLSLLDKRFEEERVEYFGDPEPFTPIRWKAKKALDARRADVVALREATRCTRVSPPLSGNPVGFVPSLLAARYLVILGSLEGHERAQAGDLAGAADGYLDLVRFGGDVGRGNLTHALIGFSAEQIGLVALGRLMRSGRLEPELLDRIEHERALLERDRTSLAEALVNERRMIDGLGETIDTWSSSVGEPLVLPRLVPYHALAAHAVRVADPLRQQFERALANDDLEAWKELSARSDSVAGSSWNPLLRLVMGYSSVLVGDHGKHSNRLFFTARENLAWFRLVQAAVMLERDKRARGHYPSDATALDLPKDPFAPSLPLKYRPDGSSYRVWSIGMDGIDDGGRAEKRADIVL
jgi:hypothetical protein